jgi:hypothetical protein
MLKTWCQIQPTSTSLRYVNCGPGHTHGTYIYAYLGFNIHLKVAPLLFEVSRQFNARYNANLVPIAAHILQLTLCELWLQPYTKYLQLRTFRLQYSTACNCAAIRGISTIQYALYCNLGANYSAQPPAGTMWTVVPDIYIVDTAAHIQTSVFNWNYLRSYSRYADICMCVILQIWCHR